MNPSVNYPGVSKPPGKKLVAPSRRRRWWVARDVSHFKQEEQVGEGTYGQVWSARDKRTGQLVALKRIRMDNEREGFPLTAVREITLLKSLRHENIVNLQEIVTGKGEAGKPSRSGHSAKPRGSCYMVFEYMDHDLTGLLDTPDVKFTEAQIKNYTRQLLNGLAYCHERGVLHRDIKGSNLLIDNNGNLKIADFGLARHYGEAGRKYTNRVITLWYRPPELLLGANEYGPSVDMWSVGCLLAELLIRKPLFPGKDEVEQSHLIFNMTGVPSKDEWPGFHSLPAAETVPPSYRPNTIAEHLRKAGCSPGAINLIKQLLRLDPDKRISAEDALNHPWFTDEPKPCKKDDLPKFEQSTHEFQAKRRRQANALKREGSKTGSKTDASRFTGSRSGGQKRERGTGDGGSSKRQRRGSDHPVRGTSDHPPRKGDDHPPRHERLPPR